MQEPQPNSESVADLRGRLLQHAIHEDTCFYNRLNFFAVIESVLLAAFASAEPKATCLRFVVMALGLAVTAFWFWAQWLSHLFVTSLAVQLEAQLPEFGSAFSESTLGRRYKRTAKARSAMTFGLPLIFIVAWMFLLRTVR